LIILYKNLNKEDDMEKIAFSLSPGTVKILKNVGAGTLGAGAIGGAAYGGHRLGMRTGAKRTANAMATAFSEANAQENKVLADAYFKKGIALGAHLQRSNQFNGTMNKTSSDKNTILEDIYNQAFRDELEKTAFAGTLGASFKALGTGLKAIPRHLQRLRSPGKYMGGWNQAGRSGGKVQDQLTRGQAAGQFGRHLWGTAKRSKAALGTIGGVGAAGGAAGYMAGR
jgi:hypothetical protein